MAWKKDENGGLIADESGNPVLVNADGKEQAINDGYIGQLSSEAANRRRELKTATEALSKFDGIDPSAAADALQKLKNIDLSKMVGLDKLDEVRGEVSKSYQAKLDELTNGMTDKDKQIHGLLVSNAFKGSKFLSDKTILPPDLAEAYFGKNFKVENGKAIAMKDGEPIYSAINPGKHADVDEALEIMVNGYSSKDSILKGSGASGTGSQQNNGSGGGVKTASREQFSKMQPAEQMGFVKSGGTIK